MPEDHAPTPPTDRLVEGDDYYVEANRWVFTAHFLRRRGHCCNSGCRHCPYPAVPPPPSPNSGSTNPPQSSA